MKRSLILMMELVLVISLCSNRPVQAEYFYDDFEDNNLRDGVPVRWNAGTAADGGLQIRSTGSNATIAAAVVDAQVGWSMRAHGMIGDSRIYGIGIRAISGSHVYLGMWPDGEVYLGTPGVSRVSIQTNLDPNSVMLRFDAFDDVIYGWAWNVGEQEPTQPLLEYATTVSAGVPGVWNEGVSGGPTVTAEFDFFEASTSPLTVPEPTSVPVLTFIGIGMWMKRQRAK